MPRLNSRRSGSLLLRCVVVKWCGCGCGADRSCCGAWWLSGVGVDVERVALAAVRGG